MCFNELSFITASPSNYNIKTLTFCTLYTINYHEFIELLANSFPDDLVKIKKNNIFINL